MSNFDVVCGIPRSGRTFENFINKLISLGSPSLERDLEDIKAIIKQGKKGKTASLTDIHKTYAKALEGTPNIGLFVDRKRDNRPYRIGFLGYDFKLKGVSVRLEGDEPHNCSSLVSLGEVDVALAGMDELLTVTHSALEKPDKVKKWGMYNYHLPKENKVRVAGSAMLKRWNDTVSREIQDMVGFFLIAKQKPEGCVQYKYPKDYLRHLENHGDKVYVKGRYADMIRAAYPYLKIESVHDVEDAVMDADVGAVGLEIVQTGSTLKRKNLIILGAPLFLSESLYVVDYYKYLNQDSCIRPFLDQLKPVGYFDDERLLEFAYWYYALEENLGDNWINKPAIDNLFCDTHEAKDGLRPVRLQTRYWLSDDAYKIDEALDFVNASKLKLSDIYSDVKNGRIK
ncbi:MAG: hypothetical protein KAG28_04785 [Cocleimonas sp.]|nr:hypothetical protein [Cocleimonas sp.]